jgi:hypothetical protein
MTQDEIIEMARFAGITIDSFGFQSGYIEEFVAFANLVAAKVTQQEQDRCCAIVFGQCESDNVAQRTVNAIRGEA